MALLAFSATAGAATVYPNGGSGFNGGQEGWEASEGECSIGLLGFLGVCKAKGFYEAGAGNPKGSLAAETEILVNLGGLFKANENFVSPNFTVGEGGSGTLHLERELVSKDILNLTPSSTYTAKVLDRTAKTVTSVLTDTVTGSEEAFVGKDAAVTLVPGHTYAIELATETSSSVASVGLLGASWLRFDNVAITVGTASNGGGGGGNGSNGGNGKNGGNGSGSNGSNGGSGKNGGNASAGGVSGARLESLIKSSSLVGPAVLKGNRLTVKAKCPAKVGATCTLRLQGMLNRHKAATTGRRARVKKGKTKRFALKVKPAARKKVKKRGKLLFKEVARVGKSRATVYKSLRLVRR
ncbi:MAG TPA: hypothetical protein VHB53_10095 [Solirubrobacterales bacterium]|nr:hypothetical protein [Solirubrobacterales bacterium]